LILEGSVSLTIAVLLFVELVKVGFLIEVLLHRLVIDRLKLVLGLT